jgi:hypothetical protein
LEPGAELHRLEAAVLAGDPALDTPDLTHRTASRQTAFPPALDAIVTRGPVFVGRDAEIDLLAQAWKQALAGQRQVVLVAGEPGLGKSRLAAEVAQAARDDGAMVLYGRCDDEVTSPYRPWVEALGQYFTNAGDDDYWAWTRGCWGARGVGPGRARSAGGWGGADDRVVMAISTCCLRR